MSDRIYDMMTERIVALLEKGVIPWKRTWSGETEPQNLISKKIYRGINYFLLRCLEQRSAYFMTFNQAKKVGGRFLVVAFRPTLQRFDLLEVR